MNCNLNIKNINLHKTSILRIPSNVRIHYCNSNSDKDVTLSSDEYNVKAIGIADTPVVPEELLIPAKSNINIY